MNFRWSLQFVYCLLHLLAWIRSETVNGEPSIKQLFLASSSTPSPGEKRESLNTVYTEGGTIDGDTKDVAEETGAKLNVKKLDEIDLKIPSAETTRTNARKGKSSVVARKGVSVSADDTISVIDPQLYESPKSSLNLMSSDNSSVASSSKNNYSIASNSTIASSDISANHSTEGIKPKTEASSILPGKPTITVVPADSDAFLKSLKNDRNVIIPVVALVFVPLVVLLALFIYKRIDEARGTHYTRMGFLIEDIYND